MFEPLAITPSTRSSVVAALVAAALALVGLAELRETPQAVPCAVRAVDHARPMIRTRSPGLEQRYLTRTLCTHDGQGRRICAR
jgi:hypothetical protein